MKKTFCTMIILAFVLLLSSCGKEQGESREKFYEIEYLQETGIDLPCQAVCSEKGVWALATVKDTPIYFYNRESASISLVDWNMGNGEYIIAMVASEEVLYLAVHTENGVQIRRGSEGKAWENIAEFTADDVGNMSSFWVDKRENFYFVLNNEIYITNADGQGRRLFLNGRIVFWEESGKVKCLVSDQKSLSLQDIGNDEPVEIWRLEYPCHHNLIMVDSSEPEVWLGVDESLLCISSAFGEILSKADLIQCGISTMDVYCGAFIDRDSGNERLCLYGKSREDHLIVYQLGEQSENAVIPREEIVYGTLAINSTMMDHIVEFNKQNKDYYVTVHLYGNGDFENGRMQLQTALGSDKGPDIINLFFVDNCDDYIRNGYLEDLTPYFQAAGESGENKYGRVMWQIMEPYYTDDKIYVLLPHFTLSGLVISREDTAGMTEWNVDKMFALIEKNAGQKNIFTSSASEKVLSLAVRGMREDFIDTDSKNCHFEEKEFIQLLEYCRQYGREPGWSGTLSMEDMAQITLFLDMTFSSYIDYLVIKASYGQGIEIYGYPNAMGQEYIVNKAMDACGLNSRSDNKAGAWEFISTLLDSAYQETEGMGWPVCRDAYYNVWENAKGVPVRIEGTDYCVEEEDIEVFKHILEKDSFQSGGMDENIMNIILEEADSFFAGDKSARDAAAVIQSRVQLVLDE